MPVSYVGGGTLPATGNGMIYPSQLSQLCTMQEWCPGVQLMQAYGSMVQTPGPACSISFVSMNLLPAG